MTDPASASPASAPRSDPDPVLPDQTIDDTDAGWGDGWRSGAGENWTEAAKDDERFLRERPPHWQ